MKKLLSILLSLILIFTLVACSNDGGGAPKPEDDSGNSETGNDPSFVFIVTNRLGDKSFNDSAAEGMKKIADDLGFKTNVIEVGEDQTKWEPTILDVAESGDYSVIFLNGSGTIEIVEKVAPDFPEVKFVLFDAVIEDGSMTDNVYAISYKQNEGSYLGGVLAGLVTVSDMENSNSDKKIGFIGGDEGPIITDFLVGYVEGAKSVVPDIQVYVSYVGSWTDTAKAKELAIAQFNKGVDVIFPAAMTAGLGTIEAAVEQNKYIIGVDSDQALLLEENNPEQAEVILTSVIKNVGESLYHYAVSVKEGTDKYNTTEVLGVKEGTTGIIENKYYEKNVPDEIKTKIEEAKEHIIDGTVEVTSALGGNLEEAEKIIDSVAP